MANHKTSWVHVRTITESEPFRINGIDIWSSDWKSTGEWITIQDPLYGKDFSFAVYVISNENTTAKFAAGEFSNGVWGFYEEVK